MRINGIEYNGQTTGDLTFKAAAGLVAGDAATQTAAGEAGRGAAENALVGSVASIENGMATVRTKGVRILKYTGAVAVGLMELVVDGTGKIKPPAVAASAGARKFLVLGIDATAGEAAVDLG